ncbi:MAG TPA: acyl-CoA dehydrogenase C-terminal domain-containing protein, partial [Bauldia sp.]|nr:acyl-CoA dehydrogenase C-terminal domain-containing protein [Bauldia sp.]
DLTAEIGGTVAAAEAARHPALGRAAARLAGAADDLAAATGHIRAALAAERTREALAGATPFLRLMALTTAAGILVRAALAARDDDAGVATARHFAETVLVETAVLRLAVTEGAAATEAVAAAGLAPFPGAPGRP